MTSLVTSIPIEIPTSPRDDVNRRILEVSEDQVKGFSRNPMREIARRSGLEVETVIERIQAMLRIGVIRRVRQTLLATNLAQGALIAWKITPDKLERAFEFISKEDPFSGHVVIRNSEFGTTDWPLWTTLKVPTGFSVEKHCDYLRDTIGAEKYRIMPALRAFVLGVGHMRRKQMRVGEMADAPAMDMVPAIVDLDERDWRDAGPELDNVNIMAVAHGETKEQVMAHKAAIDKHLVDCGVGLNYTNVYWGGRAEIKPSEISPAAYRAWAAERGLR